MSGGEKVPRKGGPGIQASYLLVINKTDLAPHVGANLEVMDRDTRARRNDRPFVFSDLKRGAGVPEIVAWIRRELLFEDVPAIVSGLKVSS